MKKLILFTTFYFLLTISLSLAQSMTITANNLVWDKKEGVVTLKEEVVITFEEGTIKAPLVKGFGELRDLKKIEAEGGVIIIDNEQRIITGEHLEYFKEKGYALISKNTKLIDESDSLQVTAEKFERFFKDKKMIFSGEAKAIKGVDEFRAEKIIFYDEGERIEMIGGVKGVVYLEKTSPSPKIKPLKKNSVMVVENNSLVTGRIEEIHLKEASLYSFLLNIISSEDIDNLPNFTKQMVGQTIEVFSNQEFSSSLLSGETIQGKISYSKDEQGGRFWIREIRKQ